MPLTAQHNHSISAHQSERGRVELARELYRQYYASCFWHSPRDLEINEDRIPFVARGLRANGGRDGFIVAGKLQQRDSGRAVMECR
jgi:hypothetical protein